MNMIYVDMQYSYGKKERGVNYIGRDGFLKTFVRLGHTVEPFYYDDYLDNTKPLQQDLIHFSDKIRPDLIFFSLYTDQFDFATLDYLKSKYKTVAWFGDDTWRFDNFSSSYAPHFTWCITTDKFSVEKYRAIGQSKVIESQWAAIDEHPISEWDGKYDFDVSFVGLKNDYREWFIDELRRRGIKVEVFGQNWENGPVSNEKMIEIFLKSRINLNIPNSFSFDIRFLTATRYKNIVEQKISKKKLLKSLVLNCFSFGSLLNAKDVQDLLPIAPTEKSRGQVKARNFEIPFFGGFQVTDYFPGIEDYFIIGEEIVCFKDIDESELLIKYFLKNNERRENIRKKSHLRAVKEHGYFQRFQKIFENFAPPKD